MDSSKNLPWVEKYRPQSLDELISHKEIISTIGRFVKEGRLPHLLFYGPPGTGKTTMIHAVARQIYTPAQFASMVLELNASDDRGIEVVRQRILNFASTKTIFTRGFKIVILDEADAMTRDAQNALRRIIEKYTKNARFCIVCNYLSKIIPALQSRCTRFRFAPLSADEMMTRVQHVASQEGLNTKQDGLDAVVTLGGGDMRRSINILQCTAMAFDQIDELNVYTCVGHPLRKDIENILSWMLNESFSVALSRISELKILKGLALVDILTEVHVYVHRISLPSHIRIQLLEKLSDIEYRLSFGTSEKLQLSSLVAAFQTARSLVFEDANKMDSS